MTPEIRKILGAKRGKVSHLIQYELRVRGYNGARLARELKCSENNVSRAINGGGHSPMVLDAMREIGVPEKYLFDPRRHCLPEPLQQPEIRESA